MVISPLLKPPGKDEALKTLIDPTKLIESSQAPLSKREPGVRITTESLHTSSKSGLLSTGHDLLIVSAFDPNLTFHHRQRGLSVVFGLHEEFGPLDPHDSAGRLDLNLVLLLVKLGPKSPRLDFHDFDTFGANDLDLGARRNDRASTDIEFKGR